MVAAATSLGGFNCGNCGAAVALRALTHTRAVACTTCGAILDPRDPNVHVLQTARLRESIAPLIPLGNRGTWGDHPYDVVGFQRRSIEVDDERYHWDEYVLFNPYRGFRYLSEYQGHWNFIEPVRELPRPVAFGRRPAMECRGRTFKHFQAARARTDFVLGEFPWRVRAGDEVAVSDYIAPPLMLSSEGTETETTWSLGTYTEGAAIWKAFSAPGEPPRRIGVFANQPYAHSRAVSAAVLAFLIFGGVVLLLLLGRAVTADREAVFAGSYRFQPGEPAALVTDPFTLRDEGTVELLLQVPSLANAWIDFDLALISIDAGTAWNVAREVSFYSGTDSDGAWSEGSRDERVLLPRLPPGEYYLRVEPVSDVKAPLDYTIRVRRDVVSVLPYGVAVVLLLLPALFAAVHSSSFEQRRLQESDYSG
jgi:hypothetical protein